MPPPPPAVDFSQAAYTVAAHHPGDWPPDAGAEVAFAGRSNVGKSSAINAITRRRQLARASKTPGRTRQIVFFDLGGERRLVDLPGYGYAEVPAHLRRHWQQFLTGYLSRRACLKGLIIPMDIRRPLTESDCVMLQCCHDLNLPAHILLTKADKLKRARAAAALTDTQKQLRQVAGENTGVQLFSATDRQGVAQAAEVVAGWLCG